MRKRKGAEDKLQVTTAGWKELVSCTSGHPQTKDASVFHPDVFSVSKGADPNSVDETVLGHLFLWVNYRTRRDNQPSVWRLFYTYSMEYILLSEKGNPTGLEVLKAEGLECNMVESGGTNNSNVQPVLIILPSLDIHLCYCLSFSAMKFIQYDW